MKKLKKLILTVLITTFLFNANVFAKDYVETEKGSITISLTEGKQGTTKEEITFCSYKIADIENGLYTLKPEFENTGINLNRIQTADQLRSAAKTFADLNLIPEKTTETDKSGTAILSDLDEGGYLIWSKNDPKYDLIEPAIIAVPTWNEVTGEMLYDIKIEPKHSPRPGKVVVDMPKKQSHGFNPKTGDEFPIRQMVILISLATVGAITIVLLKKRKDKKKHV